VSLLRRFSAYKRFTGRNWGCGQRKAVNKHQISGTAVNRGNRGTDKVAVEFCVETGIVAVASQATQAPMRVLVTSPFDDGLCAQTPADALSCLA
jgi:hypothetical protein